MKSKNCILFFVLLLLSTIGFSQKQIKGTIVNKTGKKSVPFVNIGIVNSTIGTLSNSDGSFSLTIPLAHSKDTILFSALGFNQKRVPVFYFDEKLSSTIQLSERVTTLQSVTVTGKKESPKIFQLGNKFNNGGHIYGDSISAGAAMALLIENKYPAYQRDLKFPAYIKSARLRISKNTLKEFKIRIRILEFDSLTGLPGKDLLQENVITTSSIKEGWINFDLTPYNLAINKPPFFLAFEWILEDQQRLWMIEQYKDFKKLNPDKVTSDTMIIDGEKVGFYSWHGFMVGTTFAVSQIPFSLANYKSYYRNNSLGEWKRASAIPAARIELSNQPAIKSTQKLEPVSEKNTCKTLDAPCNIILLCENFINENDVNGIQLAVSVHGALAFSKGFGMADVERSIPVSTNTRFRIGSVSKAVTSAALVKLVSEGKLDIDKPIQQYVPGFPDKGYTITTRQLAGHLAGICHYRENDLKDFVRTEHYRTVTDALTIFASDSLLFKPGTKYHYSSYGWNLVGAVIEGASRTPYLQYMLENIWKPLGMHSTYGDVADSVMQHRSIQYDFTGGQAAFEDLSYKYPSGGLLSTSEDLVKYGNALLHPTYLNPAITPMLFQTQKTDENISIEYGLGWRTEKDKNGHRIFYHAGHLSNGSAFLLLYPDDDIVVAFLANGDAGLSFDVKKVGELFYSSKK